MRAKLPKLRRAAEDTDAAEVETEPEGSAVDAADVADAAASTAPAGAAIGRTLAIAALTLIVGLSLGTWVAYRLFATHLDEQAAQIDQQQAVLSDLAADSKPRQRDQHQTKLHDIQRELEQTQQALEDTRRELQQLADSDKARPPATATQGQAAPQITPSHPQATTDDNPLSGSCDINTDNLQETLARCLSNLD